MNRQSPLIVAGFSIPQNCVAQLSVQRNRAVFLPLKHGQHDITFPITKIGGGGSR